jgi:hypothetical protein
MREANAALAARIAREGADKVNIEQLEPNDQAYVEMNLACGVLEQGPQQVSAEEVARRTAEALGLSEQDDARGGRGGDDGERGLEDEQAESKRAPRKRLVQEIPEKK